MKKIKIFVAILAAVTALVLLPDASAATAEAAEPVTYAVKYYEETDEWLYWANTSIYSEDINGGSLYYLLQNLKDGDSVVVYNYSANTGAELNLGSVNLYNLTYAQGTTWAIVHVGSVQECYVLGGTSGTINCNVENAYVYDTVTFNFNRNVTNLYLYASDEIHSSVGVKGKVGHLLAITPPGQNPSGVYFNYYDFPANTLYFADGTFTPTSTNFNTEEEHASNAAKTASSDEYDAVPKTGQSNLYLLLLCASAICFAASQAVRRTGK